MGFCGGDHPLEFRPVLRPAAGYAALFNKYKLRWNYVAVRFGSVLDFPELGVRGQFGLVVGADADVGGADL